VKSERLGWVRRPVPGPYERPREGGTVNESHKALQLRVPYGKPRERGTQNAPSVHAIIPSRKGTLPNGRVSAVGPLVR
jgi:hypothetical protein